MRSLLLVSTLLALPFLASCPSSKAQNAQEAVVTATITQPEKDQICVGPGTAVTFVGAGTGEDATLSWSFGDPAIPGSALEEVPVVFANEGTFEVTLTVTNRAGKSRTDAVTVEVSIDCLTKDLEAGILEPFDESFVPKGSTVGYRGRASGGTPPYGFAWTFAGGGPTTGQGKTPSTAYDQIGKFETTLRVTDALGALAKSTITVLVFDPETSGESGFDLLGFPLSLPDTLAPAHSTYAGRTSSAEMVSVSAAGGFAVLDVAAQTVVRVLEDGGTRIGNAALTFASGFAATQVDAEFAYNAFGASLSHFDPDQDDFGITLTVDFNGVIDAAPYGDDPTSGGLLFTRPDAVREVLFSGASQRFETTSFSATDQVVFPTMTGNLISAFGREPGGSFVAVTDSSPGELYVFDRLSAPATFVGELGDAPRRVRCLGAICAISNFDSDSLTIATWSPTDEVVIVGDVPVGAGPIGIDLLELEDGDVAIASTGFLDNTFSVTVVDASGSVLSNVKKDVPTDCESPPHAIWGPERTVVFSCFESDAIVIAESGL